MASDFGLHFPNPPQPNSSEDHAAESQQHPRRHSAAVRLVDFDHIIFEAPSEASDPQPSLFDHSISTFPMMNTSQSDIRNQPPDDMLSTSTYAGTETNTRSSPHSKHKLTVPEQDTKDAIDGENAVDLIGMDTMYSPDTAVDNPYIQPFLAHLTKDLKHILELSPFIIEQENLKRTLKNFAWRLHGESSNPFQWESSVTLHRKSE